MAQVKVRTGYVVFGKNEEHYTPGQVIDDEIAKGQMHKVEPVLNVKTPEVKSDEHKTIGQATRIPAGPESSNDERTSAPAKGE